MQPLWKLKIQLLYDSSILLLAIYPKELKVVSWRRNGILFTFRNEGNSDTCYTMDEPWGHYAQWNKPVTKALNESAYSGVPLKQYYAVCIYSIIESYTVWFQFE